MTCNYEVFQQNALIRTQQFESSIANLPNIANLTILENDPLANVQSVEFLSQVTNKINTTLLSTAQTIIRTDYPDLADRVDSLPLTSVEIADFIQKSEYTEFELNVIFSSPLSNNALTVSAARACDRLETYFVQNFSASASGGICSAFGNIFAQLNTVLALFGGLQNILEGNILKGLIGQLKGLIGPILAIKQTILNLVDKLKDKLKSVVDGMFNQISNFVESMQGFISKKIQQIKNFFNDLNMDKLKDKISELIDNMAAQFESLTSNPNIIPFLMFKLCALVETVQAFMKNPVDGLTAAMAQASLNERVVETNSSIRQAAARAAGAIRLPYIERRQIRERTAQTLNRGSGASAGRPNVADLVPRTYVTEPISVQDRERVNRITDAGYPGLMTFADGVVNMGRIATAQYESTGRGPEQWDPSENYDTAGWQHVVTNQPTVFVRLLRVAERMQEDGHLNGPLQINSAFRSRWYNRIYQREILGNRGAAWNSQHMSCNAIDVSYTATKHDPAIFIQYASQEGFKGIGLYNSFVHVDLSDRRYWIEGGSARARAALPIHSRDGFRTGA